MSPSNTNRKIKTYNPQKRNNNKLIATAIIAVILIGIIGYVVATNLTGSSSPNNTTPTPTSTATPTATPTPFNASNVVPATSPAGQYSASGTKILFETSKGDIVIQLRDDRPITTTNFVKLVNDGYYNNTIFQRVMAGFMIQGGEGKTTQPTIQDEANVSSNINSNMTIAMANTGAPSSASTQFFINVADNNNLYPSFDTSYTVFGQVIYGQDVVMAISNAPVGYSSEYNANVLPTPRITLIGAAVLPT